MGLEFDRLISGATTLKWPSDDRSIEAAPGKPPNCARIERFKTQEDREATLGAAKMARHARDFGHWKHESDLYRVPGDRPVARVRVTAHILRGCRAGAQCSRAGRNAPRDGEQGARARGNVRIQRYSSDLRTVRPALAQEWFLSRGDSDEAIS